MKLRVRRILHTSVVISLLASVLLAVPAGAAGASPWTLSGSVTTASGSPAVGASVRVFHHGAFLDVADSATVAANGSYSLTIPATEASGTLDIGVVPAASDTASAYTVETVTVTGSAISGRAIALKSAGYRVAVTYANTAVAAGALVRVRSVDGTLLTTAFAGSGGVATFPSISGSAAQKSVIDAVPPVGGDVWAVTTAANAAMPQNLTIASPSTSISISLLAGNVRGRIRAASDSDAAAKSFVNERVDSDVYVLQDGYSVLQQNQSGVTQLARPDGSFAVLASQYMFDANISRITDTVTVVAMPADADAVHAPSAPQTVVIGSGINVGDLALETANFSGTTSGAPSGAVGRPGLVLVGGGETKTAWVSKSTGTWSYRAHLLPSTTYGAAWTEGNWDVFGSSLKGASAFGASDLTTPASASSSVTLAVPAADTLVSVVDGASPVSDGFVSLWKDLQRKQFVAFAPVNSAGQASLWIPSGTTGPLYFSLNAPGRTTVMTKGYAIDSLTAVSKPKSITLDLAALMDLRGVITDASGAPVSGALLRCFGFSVDGALLGIGSCSATTAADGSFAMGFGGADPAWAYVRLFVNPQSGTAPTMFTDTMTVPSPVNQKLNYALQLPAANHVYTLRASGETLTAGQANVAIVEMGTAKVLVGKHSLTGPRADGKLYFYMPNTHFGNVFVSPLGNLALTHGGANVSIALANNDPIEQTINLPLTNINGTLAAADGASIANITSIYLGLQMWDAQHSYWTDVTGANPATDGTFNLTIQEAGKYRINAWTQNSSVYPVQSSTTCVLANAQSQVTDPFTCNAEPSVPVYKTERVNWPIVLHPANIFGKATNWPSPLPNDAGGYVQPQRYNPITRNWDWLSKGFSLNSDGSFKDRLTEDGIYRYRVNVSGLTSLTSTFTPCVAVVNGLVETLTSCTATPTGSGASVLGSAITPGLAFALAAPGINGVVIQANGETATFTSGAWFNVMAQRYYAEKDTWLNSNEWGNVNGAAGTFQLTLSSDAGMYRLWLYPTSNSNYATTYTSTCVLLDAQGQMTDPFTCSSPPASPVYKTSITWRATINSPNVYAKVTNFPGTWPTNAGRSASLQKWQAQQGYWEWMNKQIDVQANGVFTDRLDTDGIYRYRIYVSGVPTISTGYSPCIAVVSGKIETLTSCTATPAGTGGSALGTAQSPGLAFALPAPNVSGRILYKGQPVVNSNVELRKAFATGGWEWIANTNTDANGRFTMNAEAVAGGTRYVLVAFAPWDGSLPGASETSYEIDVTPSESTRVDGGAMETITLLSANVSGTVKMPNGGAVTLGNGPWINVQLQKFDDASANWNWLSGVSVDSSGNFQYSVRSAGLYRFWIEPNGISGVTTTQSSCFAVNGSAKVQLLGECKLATANANGWLDAIDASTRLTEPNFKGHVTYSGQPVQAWMQLLQHDELKGDTYISGIQTDAQGNFGFVLTGSGTYVVRAHVQSGDMSGASISYTFNRANSTVTSADTLTATSGVWQMPIPTANVTGYLRAPDGTYLSSANGKSACVQLQRQNSNGDWEWLSASSCTSANGSFRLIASEQGTLRLRVNLWGYPDYTAVTSSSFTAAGGFSDTITVGLPSLRIAPRDTSGNPIKNSWVELRDQASGMWVDNFNIDATGFGAFKFTANGTYEMFINPPWNVTNVGARSRYLVTVTGNGETATVSGATKDANGRWIVELASPNFLATVKAADALPTTQGWLEVQDGNGWWLQGTQIAMNTGGVSLYLTPPQSGVETFTVNVWPGDGERGVGFSKRSYRVAVTAAGGVRTYNVDANGALTTEVLINGSGKFDLSYAPATVKGTVSDPGGSPVRDSWVVPITGYGGEFWQFGTNSAVNGFFGMALPDASYQLVARAPWNRNDVANSQICSVALSGGQLSNSLTTCPQTNGQVQLQLRQPNFTVRIVDENNNPMRNTWVWFNFGVSGTGRNTDINGNATFLVDPAEQLLLGKYDTSTSLGMYLWISPSDSNYAARNVSSWNNSDLLPMVSLANATFSADTVTVQLRQNNTTITVKKPDGTTAAPGTWVELYKCMNADCTWFNWIGGVSANGLGQAKFQVESLSDEYIIHLWPGGQSQASLSETWISGESLTVGVRGRNGGGILGSRLDGMRVDFQAPNVIGTVHDSAGAPNRNGWVMVEKCTDSSGTSCSWATSAGLGWAGKYAFALEPDAYYRITAYPGTGLSGARGTSAVFRVPHTGETGADITVNFERIVDMDLPSGNVTGSVYRLGTNTKAAGIIVIATQGATEYSTVTNATGDFGFNLTSGTWTLTAVPADAALQSGTGSVTLATDQTVQTGVRVELGN